MPTYTSERLSAPLMAVASRHRQRLARAKPGSKLYATIVGRRRKDPKAYMVILLSISEYHRPLVGNPLADVKARRSQITRNSPLAAYLSINPVPAFRPERRQSQRPRLAHVVHEASAKSRRC